MVGLALSVCPHTADLYVGLPVSLLFLVPFLLLLCPTYNKAHIRRWHTPNAGELTIYIVEEELRHRVR